MNTKKAVAVMIAVCGAAAAGLLAAPGAVLNSIPTATIVKVAKVEHEDSISLSGTVARNLLDDSISVVVYVPEQDISKVTVGQSAEITGEAFPGITYSGTVEKIADVAAKVQSGNLVKTAVEVTVGIIEPDEVLKHGYTASVKLCTSEPSVMTLVPYEAVNQDEEGEFVYILTDGKAYKRYVETGRELSDGIELKTPLGDNEEIITVDELSENGSAVKLAE